MDGQPSRPADPHSSSRFVYRARHDFDGSAALSTTVVHALADCMNVDVTDGSISLYDSVDPDALDSLFRPRYDGEPRSGGAVAFSVADHHVTVRSNGEILIEPPGSG